MKQLGQKCEHNLLLYMYMNMYRFPICQRSSYLLTYYYESLGLNLIGRLTTLWKAVAQQHDHQQQQQIRSGDEVQQLGPKI